MTMRAVRQAAIAIGAATMLVAVGAFAADYSMGVEVTEHSNLREQASSSSKIVSELSAGDQLIADPVAIETPDDPECKEWLAVEYRMTGSITLHGFLCASLTKAT